MTFPLSRPLSLGLEDQFAEDWDKIDHIEKQQRKLKRSVDDPKESRNVYADVIDDVDVAIEFCEKLEEDLDDGKSVYAPSEKLKNRKRSVKPKKFYNKSERSKASNSDDDDDDDDDFIVNDDEGVEEEEDNGSETGSDSRTTSEEPLTKEAIEEKLVGLKETRSVPAERN